jgi:hypothetical protein
MRAVTRSLAEAQNPTNRDLHHALRVNLLMSTAGALRRNSRRQWRNGPPDWQNDRRLSMNAYEANEDRLLSELELDAVTGGNPFIVWGMVLASCAVDALTDGAFSRPLSLDSIRQTMGQ